MRNSYVWACLAALPLVAAAAEPSFHRDVRPILAKNCAGCHQPSSKSSGLDVTTFAAFKTGGKRGVAFTPGSPEDSLTIKYMTGAMKPSMPLGQPMLPDAEIAVLRDWIKAGAKDDSPVEATSNAPTVYLQPPVITALRFSPDGKRIAVSGNREVLVHNIDGTGAPQRLMGKAERILSIAWSPDGSTLVAGGGTPARFGEVQFWDVASGKQRHAAELTTDTVFGASISPDGSKVVVGCADNTVHGFDTKSGKELYKMSSHENWVLATVFGSDSKRFVSVGRDRAAKLVDAGAGQFLENVNQMRGELSAVARHPKKDWIVIGGEERIPYVYMMDRPRNLKVGEEATLVRKLDRQDGPIFSLDWSPDGKLIAVAGAAPNVTLYNADTGDRVAACTGHTAGIYAIHFSSDGRRLATGGFDGQVRIYNAADCKLEKAFVPVPLSAGASGGGVQ
jgi:WD40 repeat protein/mono/diheme cytochrome c family protein